MNGIIAMKKKAKYSGNVMVLCVMPSRASQMGPSARPEKG